MIENHRRKRGSLRKKLKNWPKNEDKPVPEMVGEGNWFRFIYIYIYVCVCVWFGFSLETQCSDDHLVLEFPVWDIVFSFFKTRLVLKYERKRVQQTKKWMKRRLKKIGNDGWDLGRRRSIERNVSSGMLSYLTSLTFQWTNGQSCIFCSILAETDGKSRTGMQTGTR